MATTEQEKPKTRKRSAKSLRNEIRAKISGIDDEAFLRALVMLVRAKEPPMPEELLKKLEEAEKDIAEGRVHTHEEVMKRMRTWLAEH